MKKFAALWISTAVLLQAYLPAVAALEGAQLPAQMNLMQQRREAPQQRREQPKQQERREAPQRRESPPPQQKRREAPQRREPPPQQERRKAPQRRESPPQQERREAPQRREEPRREEPKQDNSRQQREAEERQAEERSRREAEQRQAEQNRRAEESRRAEERRAEESRKADEARKQRETPVQKPAEERKIERPVQRETRVKGTPPAVKPPAFVERRGDGDNQRAEARTTVRVSRPTERITETNVTVRQIERPRSDDRGRVIVERETRRHPTTTHVTIVNNVTVVNNIHTIYTNRTTLVRNRHYWVDNGNFRYSYYWDGVHFWSGFYVGSTYYWTRYYYDSFTGRHYWRWYDPLWGRWCYWHNGYWWWEHPTTRVVYVYRDNAYYRYYETRSGVVYEVDTTRPIVMDPDVYVPSDNARYFYSDDGSRMVQILGYNRKAHLYNQWTNEYLADLGEQVTDVEFGYKTSELGYRSLSQIVVQREMGGRKSFTLYDQDGNLFQAEDGASREELNRTKDELDRTRDELNRTRDELENRFDNAPRQDSPVVPVQPGNGEYQPAPPQQEETKLTIPAPPKFSFEKAAGLGAVSGASLGALTGSMLAKTLKIGILRSFGMGALLGAAAGAAGGLLIKALLD